MDIRQMIDRERKRRGWSQRQLAAIAGLEQQTVQRFLTDCEDMRLSNIEKLFNALDISAISPMKTSSK